MENKKTIKQTTAHLTIAVSLAARPTTYLQLMRGYV